MNLFVGFLGLHDHCLAVLTLLCDLVQCLFVAFKLVFRQPVPHLLVDFHLLLHFSRVLFHSSMAALFIPLLSLLLVFLELLEEFAVGFDVHTLVSSFCALRAHVSGVELTAILAYR